MSILRWIPKRWKQRMALFTPRGFPDVRACGAFYDARAGLFTGDATDEQMMALEYGSVDGQQKLFSRAAALLPPQGKILDVGCGLGHLVDYADRRSLPFEAYHGIDVSQEMVARAAQWFADRSEIRFELRDILSLPFEPRAFSVGYIISVLGYAIGSDPMATMIRILRNAYEACSVGVVFSHLVEGRKPGLVFTSVPSELAERLEQELGCRAVIDDDGEDFTYLMALLRP